MSKVLSSEALWKEGGGYYTDKPEDLLRTPLLPDAARLRDRRILGLFREHGKLGPGSSVLEIGCGRSMWLPFLARTFGCQVTGLDIEPYAAELARANLVGSNVGGQILCRDAFDPSANEDLAGRFDLIYSMGVMEHFDDASERLAVLARYLKPGGRILTTVPNLQGVNWLLQRLASLERLNMHVVYSAKKLTGIHERAGLTTVAAGYAGFHDGFLSGGDPKTPPLRRRLHEQLSRLTNLAGVAWVRLWRERCTPEIFWLSPHVYYVGSRDRADAESSRKTPSLHPEQPRAQALPPALAPEAPGVPPQTAPRREPAAVARAETPAAKIKPRVALVAASLDILGGQGVQARALVEGLEQEGYKVRFVPINPAFPRRLKWLRRMRYLRTVLNQALYLPSLAALRGVDVVHVFSASYWSFLLAPVPAMVAARLFRKRVVLHYHSGEAYDHLANWGVFVHPWLRLADEIVVPSEYLREVFSRYGYRTRVIRNIVDTTRFRFRRRDPLRPHLLSVRNFESYYRVDIILQAFAYIRHRFPDATLTLAGEGGEEQMLRQIAARIPGGAIRFVGRVEPGQMQELYDGADIFVNASVVDNQPVSVLEAFAAGLPVVTTATGDIAAMVREGETGRIVPPEDPLAIAEAVIALLEDPDSAQGLAQKAREEAERYTWFRVRDSWASAYKSRRRKKP
ncbi:MAG TPA: glycosyltransferase [Gammaproteobacteria bacterium]|nr:glycosyltransferase [Gammaproteobacteria bacterium]